MNDDSAPAIRVQVLKVHPRYIKALVHGQRWVFADWAAVLRAAAGSPQDLERQAHPERKQP